MKGLEHLGQSRQVVEQPTSITGSVVPPWGSPPENLMLNLDEVHVWQASLDLSTSLVPSLQQILSEDEKERAQRFCFRRDQDHYIAARGILRTILAQYLRMEPCQIRFCYGSQGKPDLAEWSGEAAIRFNLSHSHGLAVVAVTRGREVGIDLERISRNSAVEQIAEKFFSPNENAALRALPAHRRQEAFFTCWTRKEAYIKARGEGLGIRLDGFDVSLVPGEPVALLNVHDNPSEAARWSLRELNPRPGFVAAIAVEGHDWQLKCWQWQ